MLLGQRGELGRDRGEALLALARSGAETGVTLDFLDIAIASRHRVLEVSERDVLAAAQDDLSRHDPTITKSTRLDIECRRELARRTGARSLARVFAVTSPYESVIARARITVGGN